MNDFQTADSSASSPSLNIGSNGPIIAGDIHVSRIGKKKTKFSSFAIKVLKKEFAANPTPNYLKKQELSMTLGMSFRQVTVWFANNRARSLN